MWNIVKIIVNIVANRVACINDMSGEQLIRIICRHNRILQLLAHLSFLEYLRLQRDIKTLCDRKIAVKNGIIEHISGLLLDNIVISTRIITQNTECTTTEIRILQFVINKLTCRKCIDRLCNGSSIRFVCRQCVCITCRTRGTITTSDQGCCNQCYKKRHRKKSIIFHKILLTYLFIINRPKSGIIHTHQI